MASLARTSRFLLAPVAVAAALLAESAGAQQSAAPAAAASAASTGDASQTVVVTGTRRSNRTVAESESPIDVLSAKDLQASGTPA